MSLRHANEPVNPSKRGRAGERVPGEAGNVASVLALQRSIGNAATRQLMRDTKVPDKFKVVVVPDGETGLSKAAIQKAIAVVKQELVKVTAGSHDATVRKGFSVDLRDSDGDLEGLHKRVFLVYLMQDRDADHAVRLARPHMPPRSDDMLKEAAHELNAIGGANLRIDFNGRSPSVSFASTGALATFVKDRDGGDKLAGQLLGEIILHEIGHALRARHDTGIMEGRAVFDAATLGKPRHFSSDSVSAMRERLEYLADH
jgi:hypothetical protein